MTETLQTLNPITYNATLENPNLAHEALNPEPEN